MSVPAVRRSPVPPDLGPTFWERAPELLAVVGFDGIIRGANPELERTLAGHGETVVGRSCFTFITRDDHEEVRRRAEHVGAGDGAAIVRTRLRLADGSNLPFAGSIAVRPGEENFYVIGVAVDGTLPVRASEASAYRDAFDEASIGMALVAFGGADEHEVVHANDALGRITGYTPDEMIGRPISLFLHPSNRNETTWLNDVLQAGGRERYTVEHRIEHADGHLVWAMMSVSIIRDDVGVPAFQVVQVQDISHRMRYERRLEFLAEHDPMTGLCNRRRFAQEVHRQAAYVRRHKGSACVLFLDLDNFKHVNDGYGHTAGDDLLVSTAAVLRNASRETDVIARLGGDEFALLLPETTAESGAVHAERIRSAVAAAGFEVDGRAVRMTVSIGVAEFDGKALVAPEDVMMDADLAMYEAKEGGRDAVRVFGPTSTGRRQMAARMTWSVRIRDALEHDRFVLHAQPLLDIRTGEITQYELLIRMRGADGTLIMPNEFLYTAERFGMALAIDKWVLGQAIDILERLPADSSLKIAANVSGGSLDGTELTDWLTDTLHERDVSPARLVIEVTETDAITNMDRARRFADALQALDCEFALDDFGAGFGSFYYLKHLPIDYLKIDGDYVRDLTSSDTDQVIVKAVVQLASGLGKRTVAEFVGDQATLDLITEIGADYAQGYFIGPPLPLAEIPALR